MFQISVLHGEEEEERKALMLAANLNMAICNLKLNRPTIAIRESAYYTVQLTDTAIIV